MGAHSRNPRLPPERIMEVNQPTDLSAHRAKRSSTGTFAACSCGEVWLRGCVVIENGKVTGYSLPLECTRCGREVTP